MATEPLETTVAKHGVLLAQHGQQLKEIKNDLAEQRKGNGEIAEMFGKIMAATTHTADGVVALNSTLSTHAQQIDRRFAELKLEQDRVCALKHGSIEQRFVTLEQGKSDIVKKVEDMSENSKVFYIRDLENKLGEVRASQTAVKSQRFEWKRVWFAGIIALIAAAIASATTWATARKPAEHEHHSAPVGSK